MASGTATRNPPTFNRKQIQHANIVMTFGTGGQPAFADFSEIAFSDTCEVAEARGASPIPMGRTTGEYKASGSFSIFMYSLPTFQSIVAANSPSGNSIYDAIFDITVQIAMKGAPGQPTCGPQMYQLQGCNITGIDTSSSAGNSVVMAKINLYVPLIIWNGYSPLDGVNVGNLSTITASSG